MENQHRKITGYRELDEVEIALMNEIKEHAKVTGDLVEKLKNNATLDKRWLAVGATDLQTGFMALTRAVAQPEFF